MTQPSPSVMCCGEALIDMLPKTDTEGHACCRPVAGGAVFNTAIALGRLGVPTGFLAGLSSDLHGELLMDTLSDSGVDTQFCPRSAAPTTLAFVRTVNGDAQYTFYDENTAGRSLAVSQLPKLPDTVDALHFGAISLVSEPCGSTYESLLLQESGKRVISLDPNIRPGFIQNETAHRDRINRLIDASDILKVSDADLAWMEPGLDITRNLDNWMQRVFDKGVKVIAVTRGGETTLLTTAQHRCELAAQPRKVVDTVGAGDTFNAGLLSALHNAGKLSHRALDTLEKADLDIALERAMLVAGIVVERDGANPPWASELPA